ncbi:MAG: NAD-dependent epimerase/dehydratase family protein [Rhodothermales bacterium]
MKAFVTGGTGFIGSHLVEELLRRGYEEVRCLVRGDKRWLTGLNIREIGGDLFSTNAIREAVSDVDYVFHVGGVTRATDWDTFQKANVLATEHLLEVVAEVNPGIGKVLVTSSLAAVGRCTSGVATEELPLQPISRYGKSKADMEAALEKFHSRIPLVVIRPPAVYGPREADIYTFFRTIKAGICPVVGDPRASSLSLVHVRDLVRGMAAAAEAPSTRGETYFIGSETFYSWNDVKDAATAALGRRSLTVSVPPAFVGVVGTIVEMVGRLTGTYPPLNREKALEIRSVCKRCSTEKAMRDFGYRQEVGLQEGVAETIAWYRREGWL